MNENGRNRREWVKTAAIIFLAVLLVLTFFSNTIMNYSLPEVAVQYVKSGTITAKIRGNGVVESSDPYNICVRQTRKVASVAVKEGDLVAEGDILIYLAGEESEELKAAQEALETAQENYDLALLAADVNASVIQDAHSDIPTATYREQIDAAQAEVKAAQEEVDKWQEKYDAVAKQIALTPSNNANTDAETNAFNAAKNTKENADFALTAAQNNLDNITARLEYEESVSDGDAAVISDLTAQKMEAERVVLDAEATARDAALAYDRAKLALENKVAGGDTTNTVSSLTAQQALIQVSLDEATDVLTEKQEALTNLTSDINHTLSLETLYNAITDAREKVAEETEKAEGSVITADIAGTVIQINTAAGKEVSAAEPVVVIQPEGKGYTMSFSVTNEQAKRLAVGDRAELINSWYYDDVEITLASIRPDKNEPGQKKLLTFDVSGDVTAGQSLNISVGQKSANYDLIVPNSAIREDNNGKFVLIVESKNTPLGNRYIATRVDIEVLASDDTQSAISGALYGYEFIITTSTKPVEAGQLVRLVEN